MKTPEKWSREIYEKCHSPVMGRATVKPAVVAEIQADARKDLLASLARCLGWTRRAIDLEVSGSMQDAAQKDAEEARELLARSEGTPSPSLPLALPDSDGWWWCRAKHGYQPGDELCVEVSVVRAAPYPGVIVRYGRDTDYIRPADPVADLSEWFYDMEWVKAETPW